jgi:hypothetical protein
LSAGLLQIVLLQLVTQRIPADVQKTSRLGLVSAGRFERADD